ncbi:MAG: tRNA (adenosine(37)-N6)-threonylcarbamoyltransferase complex dimerization subunit type 1 TsaB [Aquiluna sp.]|nr:tRNA (adenosine(37)-N6)-threonylcarbamoyltransferase complex dimerization subunit type 1 TsaB [Aquiluna sp.]
MAKDGKGCNLLLAIDTSAGTTVAVFDGDMMKSFISYEDRFGHAENIGFAITRALDEAGIVASDLTMVAVGRGPAPYTGLRVGIAAGVSLATALNIPAVGVITLLAVAKKHPSGKVLIVADAKRKELFVASFSDGEVIMPPSVSTMEQISKLSDFQQVDGSCDAGLVGKYAIWAGASGMNLTDTSALYLRSPDVSPSKGKRVTG